jgi:hypothetical protein
MKRTALFLGLLFVSCQNGTDNSAPANAGTEKEVAQTMGSKRVLFAHQSVGGNIMEGVRRLAADIPIVEAANAAEYPDSVAPGIWHARLGKNGDPYGKIAAFQSMLAAGNAGKKFDVALMKLCYVDIQEATDVSGLFSTYTQTIAAIRNAHPALAIVHCTVPLKTHVPRGVKARLRQFFKGDLANVRRSEFNVLLRREYAGKEPVVDIAAAESLRPDGRRETFSLKRKEYEALFPGYSTDGGHLNSAGQDRVAAEFLRVLSAIQHNEENR